MPVCVLLLIAVAPVLAMVATAGNALGRGPQLAAVIALTIVLSAVVAWLVVETVRTVLGTWRRVKPEPDALRYESERGAAPVGPPSVLG
jgi:hypothetical protein